VAVFNDSVKPIIDAGKAELIASDARLCDEITLIPTPGQARDTSAFTSNRTANRACLPAMSPIIPARWRIFDWSSTRRFRSRPVGEIGANCFSAVCRHSDAGDRRTFQRRPHQARRRRLQNSSFKHGPEHTLPHGEERVFACLEPIPRYNPAPLETRPVAAPSG